jgi:hypothetical protein
MENSHLIPSGQNVNPQSLVCSISKNILTMLDNFPGIIIQFFRKTSVTTMATLDEVMSNDKLDGASAGSGEEAMEMAEEEDEGMADEGFTGNN